MGYQPFQAPSIDDATMAEIEKTMQHLEEAAQLKDEPLLWQDYNDYPASLMLSVDKALISHEVPPISIDEAFEHIMNVHRKYCNMMAIVVAMPIVALIVAAIIVIALR